MIQGATQFNLDRKGKFAIPVRYREFLLAYCAKALILATDVRYPQAAWISLPLTSISLARIA